MFVKEHRAALKFPATELDLLRNHEIKYRLGRKPEAGND